MYLIVVLESMRVSCNNTANRCKLRFVMTRGCEKSTHPSRPCARIHDPRSGGQMATEFRSGPRRRQGFRRSSRRRSAAHSRWCGSLRPVDAVDVIRASNITDQDLKSGCTFTKPAPQPGSRSEQPPARCATLVDVPCKLHDSCMICNMLYVPCELLVLLLSTVATWYFA